MKPRYSFLIAVSVVLSACSPSIERIQTILNAYISSTGEDGSTALIDVKQVDKGIYSGTYSVAKDSLTLFAYPFTAIIKKDQVLQFFKDTDDNKVAVITFLPEGQGQYHNDENGLDYNVETKASYDERIRKEEEERLAAAKRASGSGLAQKGANYLMSGHNGIIRVISYNKASKAGTAFYQKMFGSNIVVYAYKVLEANGYGTQTSAYDVVFRNGNVIYSHDASEGSDLMDYISLAASLMGQ